MGRSQMIPPHLFYQTIYGSVDLSSRCTNGSNACDRYGQDNFFLHALPVRTVSIDQLATAQFRLSCQLNIIYWLICFCFCLKPTNIGTRQLQIILRTQNVSRRDRAAGPLFPSAGEMLWHYAILSLTSNNWQNLRIIQLRRTRILSSCDTILEYRDLVS